MKRGVSSGGKANEKSESPGEGCSACVMGRFKGRLSSRAMRLWLGRRKDRVGDGCHGGGKLTHWDLCIVSFQDISRFLLSLQEAFEADGAYGWRRDTGTMTSGKSDVQVFGHL